jgi:hypothetical protein
MRFPSTVNKNATVAPTLLQSQPSFFLLKKAYSRRRACSRCSMFGDPTSSAASPACGWAEREDSAWREKTLAFQFLCSYLVHGGANTGLHCRLPSGICTVQTRMVLCGATSLRMVLGVVSLWCRRAHEKIHFHNLMSTVFE